MQRFWTGTSASHPNPVRLMHALEVGMSSMSSHIATPETLADHFGNPGVPVLATPYLVSLAEAECVRCVTPKLEPGATTVGVRLDVMHMAATPAGMQFTMRAVLKEIDNRRLVFEVQASDENEVCFMGIHERTIVDKARFLEKTQAKSRRLASS